MPTTLQFLQRRLVCLVFEEYARFRFICRLIQKLAGKLKWVK